VVEVIVVVVDALAAAATAPAAGYSLTRSVVGVARLVAV